MDVGVYPYSHGDPLLIDKIVTEFLSQGKFDKLRKECMSDADTKPAYQNLQQRVENTVTQFLKKQVWRPDLNKNQLRDSLRKHILDSKFFDAGINRIVDQVVNPNVLATVFLPEVEEVVYNYLSIPRPFDKNPRRGPVDEKFRSSGRDYEHRTSQDSQRYEKYGRERSEGFELHRRESYMGDEDYKVREILERKSRDYENDFIKIEPSEEQRKAEEKVKLEVEDEPVQQFQSMKTEIPSDESQESLNRMAAEGLRINEPDKLPVPDSDDSVPLEINEKSMSESRDSEDSIMNQMSPISQGRLTPDLEEEIPEQKPEVTVEEKPEEKEEKKPLTFIGRIPKIKREDSDSSKSSKTKEDISKKEKLEVKNIYSSDESDSSKSYGKSDSDEKRRQSEKTNSKESEKKREDSEKKHKDKKIENSKDRKRQSSKERHKEHKRERSKSRDRHKKSSSSSSSSQRERSSSHHKSSHRHKDSKSKRKEEEKKKSKSTDDHGKERNKKEDRRSTDRDSNERERGRSTGTRTDGDNRKREKEQQKSEDAKGENTQNEAEVEKDGEVVSESEQIQTEEVPEEIVLVELETRPVTSNDTPDKVLDFNELFNEGALSRLEFPKLTDDFYVKFNSTGFRYFEEWEKTKLDCEEEFKEFVDEAENDLSLLSDDDSDFEFERTLAEENQKTVKNLLRGLGNFRRSIMFDPRTTEFYKWTNNKFYQKFRKKGEKRDTSSEKTESDESIKENIDRGEKNRTLHLKLINKYRRKAMRMGKPRRRQRKPDSGGIKEKNENRSASDFFNDAETFLATRVMKGADCSLVESENSAVPNSVNSLNNLYGSETVTLPESPEENEEWSGKQKSSEAGKTNNSEGKLPESLPLNLPPSPDSDDVNSSNGITAKNVPVPRKRINRETEESVTPKKQTRRNYSQKYDSQDLYKPRPILNGSRTRGRERGLEREIVGTVEPRFYNTGRKVVIIELNVKN